MKWYHQPTNQVIDVTASQSTDLNSVILSHHVLAAHLHWSDDFLSGYTSIHIAVCNSELLKCIVTEWPFLWEQRGQSSARHTARAASPKQYRKDQSCFAQEVQSRVCQLHCSVCTGSMFPQQDALQVHWALGQSQAHRALCQPCNAMIALNFAAMHQLIVSFQRIMRAKWQAAGTSDTLAPRMAADMRQSCYFSLLSQ